MASCTVPLPRPLMFGFMLILLLLLGCQSETRDEEPGQRSRVGVSNDEIRIGSSLALTGHASFLGAQTLRGAQCYLNYINESGGIHGRTIRLIAVDDRYDPPMCLANTQQFLVEDDIFCLFCYVGTPTTVRIIPLIEQAQIPLVGAFTGANDLREPFRRYIINVRASYYQETEAAVTHLVEDLKRKRIAIFYQYDAYGFDGLRGAELALQKYGLTPVANGSYIRGTLGVEEGLERILAAEAEAVILIGTYEPCAKFIRLGKAANPEMIFYNVSFVGAEELARLLGPLGDGVLVSQVVPLPDNVEQAAHEPGAVGEYVKLLQRYFPEEKPNFVGLEGFFNAKVLVEALEQTGRDLTREGFINSIAKIQHYTLGPGIMLTFGDTDHQGMDTVYFTVIENGQLILVNDWAKLAERYRSRRQ